MWLFALPWILNVAYWIKTRGSVSEEDPLGFDLFSFRIGDRLLAAGECPYRPGSIPYAGEGGWSLAETTKIYPFGNPPFFALFVAWLRPFGHFAALAIWTACACACTWAVLAVFSLSSRARRRAALLVALSTPFFLMVRAGQSTWLTLSFVSLAWLFHQRGRHALAGIAIGMTSLRPQWAVPLVVVWFLLFREGRAAFLASAVACLIALFALGEAAWPGSTSCYLHFLKDVNGDFAGWAGFAHAEAVSVWGMLLAWLPKGPATIAYLAIVALAFAELWRGTRAQSAGVRFALGTMFCLVVSIHSSVYDWLLLVPAFCVLWREAPAHRSLLAGWLAVLMLVAYVAPYAARAQLEAWHTAVNPAWPALALAFVGMSRALTLAARRHSL